MQSSRINNTLDSGEDTIIQLCSFWISSRLFGVNILDVKEVSSDIEITPVFHAATSIEGYMNIRGQIHLVIDVRQFFGFEKNYDTVNSKVVLFKQSVDEPFGILVDKMDDVISVNYSSIEERRKKKNENSVCKLHKGLLVVLNARGILQTVEST
jgi:purine-binding chemotaxis protein CheW